MNAKSLFRLLFSINWLKSLYFNLCYFSMRDALKFPSLVYRRTVLRQMKGKIVVNGPIVSGMIRLGIPRIGVQDLRYSRTIWSNGGGT